MCSKDKLGFVVLNRKGKDKTGQGWSDVQDRTNHEVKV